MKRISMVSSNVKVEFAVLLEEVVNCTNLLIFQ